MVAPGVSTLDFLALLIIGFAIRSLTEPAGLKSPFYAITRALAQAFRWRPF